MGLLGIIFDLFSKKNNKQAEEEETKMKYLIVGLGNIGSEYDYTRHNIGFMIVDHIASKLAVSFEDRRYGFVGKCRVKNAEMILLKPTTYMNLSGNAVRYWLRKENIPIERLIVVCDDISLPLGKIRIRPQGSDGGHNGLKHIASVIGSQQYVRLKFGVGNNFPKGNQVNFVLGKFEENELAAISSRLEIAAEAVKTFCLSGITIAMNQYNK